MAGNFSDWAPYSNYVQAGLVDGRYANAGFTTLFRVQEMEATWTGSEGDAGLAITLHGQNYVEARADKILPEGEEPSNTANIQPT